MTDVDQTTQAVDRGMELLTRVVGQQRISEIRPDALDVGDTQLCVLAMLYGSFFIGCELLGIDHDDEVTYGFRCGRGSATDDPCRCDELTDRWRDRIRQLRRESHIL